MKWMRDRKGHDEADEMNPHALETENAAPRNFLAIRTDDATVTP